MVFFSFTGLLLFFLYQCRNVSIVSHPWKAWVRSLLFKLSSIITSIYYLSRFYYLDFCLYITYTPTGTHIYSQFPIFYGNSLARFNVEEILDSMGIPLVYFNLYPIFTSYRLSILISCPYIKTFLQRMTNFLLLLSNQRITCGLLNEQYFFFIVQLRYVHFIVSKLVFELSDKVTRKVC